MTACYFCGEEGKYGYEGNGGTQLWLCPTHWHMVGETLIIEFEDAGLIGEVDWQDD